MKKIKKIVASVVAPIFMLVAMPTFTFAAEPVSVKSGTPVILQLTEEINSKTKNLNDSVALTVARDVVVDGKVVIKAGTPATGTITWAEKSGIVGKEGKIQFGADSTKSIDGQRIPLRASVTQMGKNETPISVIMSLLCCFLFLFVQGKEAKFPVGTEVKAYTDQDIKVAA